MTTYATLPRELSRLLSQFALLVGYAVGCITVVSMVAMLLVVVIDPCHVQARRDRAALDIKNITLALKLYWKKKGHYPSTKEGLRALVHLQALEAIPRDPWNVEYHYTLRNDRPLVWSLGEDGALGGEDNDADIYSAPLPP